MPMSCIKSIAKQKSDNFQHLLGLMLRLLPRLSCKAATHWVLSRYWPKSSCRPGDHHLSAKGIRSLNCRMKASLRPHANDHRDRDRGLAHHVLHAPGLHVPDCDHGRPARRGRRARHGRGRGRGHDLAWQFGLTTSKASKLARLIQEMLVIPHFFAPANCFALSDSLGSQGTKRSQAIFSGAALALVQRFKSSNARTGH